MIRRALTRLAMLLLLLLTGCATELERSAVAQREAWVRERPEWQAAPPLLPAEPGLADLERHAFHRSPELRAAYARWRGAVDRIATARTLPEPTLDFGYFAKPIETRVGPQRAAIGIEQRMPWLSKLTLAGDEQALAAQAAFAEADAYRLALAQRIRALWGELYFLARRTEITAENIDLVRRWESSALARYQSSLAGQPDVARAQIALGTLQDELTRLQDRRGPLTDRLRAVVGLPATVAIPLPAALPEPPPLPEAEELHARTQSDNPQIVALRHRVSMVEVDIDRARKDYLPDLTVGLSYMVVDEARVPGVQGSGQDAVVPRVGLTVPLWWRSYQRGSAAATAGQEAAGEVLRGRRMALRAELADALFRLHDARRRRALYEKDLLPRARETLESTTSSYSSGRATILDMIDAQRTLLEFQLALERARTDAFASDAAVRALVGGGIDAPASDSNDGDAPIGARQANE